VESIRQGFFTEFEKLQGHRNTYWVTAARCFEDVEEMIRCSYDIVDRFF
jgi:hypothetical protein